MKDKLQAEIDNIMDTFTGADGGVSFMQLRWMLEALEEKDDSASKTLLRMVSNFSRLIEVAKKENFGKPKG